MTAVTSEVWIQERSARYVFCLIGWVCVLFAGQVVSVHNSKTRSGREISECYTFPYTGCCETGPIYISQWGNVMEGRSFTRVSPGFHADLWWQG